MTTSSSSLYEITSLVTHCGHAGKVVVQSMLAIGPDTITITLRDPHTNTHIRYRLSRELLPELPEAIERACRAAG